MKAMKSMNMNRVLGTLKRKPRDGSVEGGNTAGAGPDTPEANATRNVRLFCESGGPNGSGEEVLYLPTIVEACESSPAAAKEAAYVIRKFLSKENYQRPYVQYNAIMLIRILADNPGKTFTRNIDQKFVQVLKDLLQKGQDPSVKQILMETLDTFDREKKDDENLLQLREMWQKERERMAKVVGPGGPYNRNIAHDPHSQNYFSRNHRSRQLPHPQELAMRIEEARSSAKLLSQVVQSTPPSELLQNELVREFADRCSSASRTIQAYMVAENPGPDNDTMETLIDTNEQLSQTMNQHQRAVLHARKAAGLNGSSTPPVGTSSRLSTPPPPAATLNKPLAPPPRKAVDAGSASDSREISRPTRDPFADPTDAGIPYPKDEPSKATGQFNDRTGTEPYHPGFRETPSYVGRQESSIGKVTMHAAVPEEDVSHQEPQSKGPIYRY